MSNLASYIGKPWACPDNPPHSFDCWSLVRRVRADLGLVTPEVRIAEGLAALHPSIMAGKASMEWRQIAAPGGTIGDVVVMGASQGRWAHCGVIVDGLNSVLHSFSPDGLGGAVRCDEMRTLRRLFNQLEIWRPCTK